MTAFPYPEHVFVLSNRLAIESKSERFLIIYDTDSSTRMKIGRKLYETMTRFRKPARLIEIISEQRLPFLKDAIEQLLDAGFLLDFSGKRPPVSKSDVRLATVSPTMFRVPFHVPGMPAADVAIVGIPYDGGNLVNPGMRNAPHELRKRSSIDQEYRVDFATGEPMGWFDVENLERILEGTTISDWGDLRFAYGEAPDAILGRLGSVCGEVLHQGSFPVFIGGDHSISYPIVEAIQKEQEVQVVWFDAHTDYGDLIPGVCHNHKNVVRRILDLPNVKRVINVGHRGYTSSDKVNYRPSKFCMVTAAQVRNGGEYPVLQATDLNLPCYISIDIDALDPIYAPGTSTPVPSGMTPQELKTLLRAIGANRRVIGCDLVEVNPAYDQSMLTVIHAYQLLTVCLGASVRAQKTEKSGEITCKAEA